MTDLPPLPPLPVLTKAERRTECGACGRDIRGVRSARYTGICYVCRQSIEERGRPLVPFAECKCDCETHARIRTKDDGHCGPPFNGTQCCFTGEDKGDPAFRALFNEHERIFYLHVEAEQERRRLEREERWRRERENPDPTLFVPLPRKLKNNWTPEAVEDLLAWRQADKRTTDE